MDQSQSGGTGRPLLREATERSTERRILRGFWPSYAILFAALGAGGSCLAQDTTGKANARLQEVIVQTKRQVRDEQVTAQVQKALRDDPWIYAEHITVTTQNGVVRVEGIVGDTGERFRILRLCWKIPGARRVVDALEQFNNDPDGG